VTGRAHTIEQQAREGLRVAWTILTDDRRKAKVIAVEVVGVSDRLERLRRSNRHAFAEILIRNSRLIHGDAGDSRLDPVLTARVLKTLSDLYMAKHVKLHETQGAYDFFAQQVDDYKGAVAKAEADLTAFSHANSTAAPQEERDLMLQKMADIRVVQAQNEAAAESALERYKSLQNELAKTPPRMVTQVKSADNAMLMGGC